MNLITVHLWFSLTLFFLSLSSISESFLTVKGAALFLPRGNGSSPSSASRFSQLRSKHAGEVKGLPEEQLTVRLSKVLLVKSCHLFITAVLDQTLI